jgi:hypothetical protein
VSDPRPIGDLSAEEVRAFYGHLAISDRQARARFRVYVDRGIADLEGFLSAVSPRPQGPTPANRDDWCRPVPREVASS